MKKTETMMLLDVLQTMLDAFKKDPSQVLQCAEEAGRMVCWFFVPIADESDKPIGHLPMLFDITATPMLTIDQAAELMKISTRTLSVWRKHGLMTIDVLMGKRKRTFFPLSLLRAYCGRIGHKIGLLRCGSGNYRDRAEP